MSPESLQRARWWLLAVVLPCALLGALAIALGSSALDPASLEPFFDRAGGEFPLRGHWFYDSVLHVGGKYLVIAVASALLIVIALGRVSRRCRPWRAHSAYLAVCIAVTAGVGGAWKRVSGQITPWHTLRFGGKHPWPGADGDLSLLELLNSPGAHSAAGFALVGLYFVGASLGVRGRAWWLVPGLTLGVLFSLTQHVRGAHPPSHEFWALAIAWGVAAGAAAWFRARGWMSWDECPPAGRPAEDEPAPRAAALLPWLLGFSGLCAGISFFIVDQMVDRFRERLEGLEPWIEVSEIILMGAGSAVVCFLLTERFRAARERAARRAASEREQRLQLLGRTAAAVAHEVRNPLHTLRLIVDEQRHELPALRSHPLRPQLDASLDRIDRAVDLVYRLARPRSADRETVDLARIVRDAAAALARHARAGRVTIGPMAEGAQVLASPDGLRIVVDNLLRNADEAAAPGEFVALDLRREGADWRLAVSNPGTLAKAPASSSASAVGASEKPGGLGLGLAISGQIAADSGARIELAESDGIVRCILRWPAAEDRGS